MPKLKKSAISAILSATIAARGSSIIVPTLYSIRRPAAANTSSATRSTWARVISSSFVTPTSGIMISGTGALPVSFATISAPSKIARACIS